MQGIFLLKGRQPDPLAARSLANCHWSLDEGKDPPFWGRVLFYKKFRTAAAGGFNPLPVGADGRSGQWQRMFDFRGQRSWLPLASDQ